MEVTALFRPHCRIRKGIIREFEFPRNVFYAAESQDLILFAGKEPNMNWVEYGDCVFTLCRRFGVRELYFIGSVAGLVPHTRDPRLFCSLSDAGMKPRFEDFGVKFSDYEGPASIVTYLTTRAKEHGLEMVSIVATVPAYVQGSNPKCIAAVTKRVAGILGVHVETDDLQTTADEFERKLTEVVQEQPELAENVVKLEQDYDNEIFSEMGELKNWLHRKGIRLD
jgi:proteasome assembly chaperone (PAC2) family protein